MDRQFVDLVREIIEPVRLRRLHDLGQHRLISQLPNLLQTRSGLDDEELAKAADVFLGDMLREIIVGVVESLEPATRENLNDPFWQYYVILRDHMVLNRKQVFMLEDLACSRAAFYKWRNEAIEFMALELWKQEQTAADHVAPVRQNLPYPPYDHYIPRYDEQGRDYVERIIENLTKTRAWYICSDGMPGVGKTTIAYETATRSVQRQLFEAVIWTTAQQKMLRPSEIIKVAEFVPSFETILEVIGKKLGNREVLATANLERKQAIVRELLATKCCLVIIDNLEALSDADQDRVYAFLQALPRPSKALVTGRQRKMVGLYTVTIPGMELSEALRFIQAETALRSLPALTPEEARQIYHATQGNPLAMQQAIGLIQSLDYPLEEALDFGQIEEHDKMLDYMYEEAYKRLKPAEQEILHVLPLFTTPATVEHIEAASGVSRVQLRVGLRRLYEAFVVQKVSNVGYQNDTGYHLLPFPREFLRAQQRRDVHLGGGTPLADFLYKAHQRLATHYIEYLKTLRFDEQLRFVKLEKENILGLMEWCYENEEWRLVIDLVAYMSRPLGTLRYLEQQVEWGKRAMRACEILGDEEQREWFNIYSVAWPYIHIGDKERLQARQIIEKSIIVAREKGYGRLEALALRNLGRLTMDEGDYSTALEFFKQSLVLWETYGDLGQGWIPHTLSVLGEVQSKLGLFAEAKEHLLRAWRLHKQSGNAEGAIATLSELALVHLALGDERRAISCSDVSISRAKMIKMPARAYAYTLRRRIELDQKLGHITESLHHAEESCRTYKALGMEYWVKRLDDTIRQIQVAREAMTMNLERNEGA